ncbi:proline-rich protein 2-like [Sciurus carolinensis]|uniref:proline-rich protein 2-like n=1 Tax=Sciurus carolinensis TaxID=30640 RepID=UPI001FB461D5|nr:proline-rich protein 2-like [Sciurus carolinensis]
MAVTQWAGLAGLCSPNAPWKSGPSSVGRKGLDRQEGEIREDPVPKGVQGPSQQKAPGQDRLAERRPGRTGSTEGTRAAQSRGGGLRGAGASGPRSSTSVAPAVAWEAPASTPRPPPGGSARQRHLGHLLHLQRLLRPLPLLPPTLQAAGLPPPPRLCGPRPARPESPPRAPPRARLGHHASAPRRAPHFLKLRPERGCGSALPAGLRQGSRQPPPGPAPLRLAFPGPASRPPARGQRGATGHAGRLEPEPCGGPGPRPSCYLRHPRGRRPGRRRGRSQRGAGQTEHGQASVPARRLAARAPPSPPGARAPPPPQVGRAPSPPLPRSRTTAAAAASRLSHPPRSPGVWLSTSRSRSDPSGSGGELEPQSPPREGPRRCWF